jgi:DNA-binding CsgD family transcriptional regulator
MKTIQTMHAAVSSKFNDKLKAFVAPLEDYLGVSQFYYYRITNSGHYASAGSNPEWRDFYFWEKQYLLCPVFRHPDNFQTGLIDLRAFQDEKMNRLTKTAKESYDVNFSLQFTKRTAWGIEVFGFGIDTDDPLHHMALLNELSLLKLFIRRYKETFFPLNRVLEDNQADIASEIGPSFFKLTAPVKKILDPKARAAFLKKMGVTLSSPLSPRETEIASHLLEGNTALDIAALLHLSKRTVEHHIERLKNKLNCDSKTDLIKKAWDLQLAGLLDGF